MNWRRRPVPSSVVKAHGISLQLIAIGLPQRRRRLVMRLAARVPRFDRRFPVLNPIRRLRRTRFGRRFHSQTADRHRGDRQRSHRQLQGNATSDESQHGTPLFKECGTGGSPTVVSFTPRRLPMPAQRTGPRASSRKTRLLAEFSISERWKPRATNRHVDRGLPQS
jgi:hypothetical protein